MQSLYICMYILDDTRNYRIGDKGASSNAATFSFFFFSLRRGNGGTSLIITLISEVPRLLRDQNTAFRDIEVKHRIVLGKVW